MADKKIGISISSFCSKYGDMQALEIAARIGADAVDFSTFSSKRYDCDDPASIYSKSDEEIHETDKNQIKFLIS